jgi:hypothetical protein
VSTATDEPIAERDDAPAEDDAPRLRRRDRIGRELVIWSFVVVAIAGAFVAVRNRETDDAFLERQAHPPTVSAADVQKAVRQRTEGLKATCTPGGSGALGSPWRCVARISNGTSRFSVTVGDRGNYASTGDLRFRGCCIPVPIP